MTICVAILGDAPEIVRVINGAFGPAESFFVEGDRVDLQAVRGYFAKGTFLVAGDMEGCVYVELRGESAYFGLLSVDLSRQKAGTGRALIAAAEEYARAHGCAFMDIRIVNLRAELPAYYAKLGYQEAGIEDFTPGVSLKLPCHFVKMRKPLL
jgi:GNAT superfamily N-acetyltransferase